MFGLQFLKLLKNYSEEMKTCHAVEEAAWCLMQRRDRISLGSMVFSLNPPVNVSAAELRHLGSATSWCHLWSTWMPLEVSGKNGFNAYFFSFIMDIAEKISPWSCRNKHLSNFNGFVMAKVASCPSTSQVKEWETVLSPPCRSSHVLWGEQPLSWTLLLTTQ